MNTGRALINLIVVLLIGFAHCAAALVFDALNASEVPIPYKTKGFGGTPIELV